MPNYQFLDANSSVLTASANDIGGGVLQPIVQINGNSSISGTIGSSIVGQLPSGTAVLGSIAALQGTNPWNVIGSVSGTVGTSIIGQLPAGTAVLGSVVTLQGTNPWNISSIYGNVSGSVLSQQLGTSISSVIGSVPSSLLTGTYGQRNDNVASFLGGNLTWNPIATDSAGRTLTRPFAAEESRIEGYISLTSTSVTTLVAAAGAGLRNYITDLWFANSDGTNGTVVTFKDGLGSVLGFTYAPSKSGSNLPGLVTPIRTGANTTFDIQATTNVSILYGTVKGFKGP